MRRGDARKGSCCCCCRAGQRKAVGSANFRSSSNAVRQGTSGATCGATVRQVAAPRQSSQGSIGDRAEHAVPYLAAREPWAPSIIHVRDGGRTCIGHGGSIHGCTRTERHATQPKRPPRQPVLLLPGCSPSLRAPKIANANAARGTSRLSLSVWNPRFACLGPGCRVSARGRDTWPRSGCDAPI